MPRPGNVPLTMGDWPRAILFDFDGVIVNSEPLHFQAFQEVLRQEGIELTEEQYYRDLIGFDDRGAFQHILAQYDRPVTATRLQQLMADKCQRLRDMIAQGRFAALPGVEQFVRQLHRHYPLGICSGALRHEIESMLDGVGLRDCFPVIVAAEDVTVGKPDPSGYLMTARQLGQRTNQELAPGDCLIVEDAPTVARSTRAAGFKVLAVATSYPIEALADAHWRVPSLHPHVVARQIPDLKLGMA